MYTECLGDGNSKAEKIIVDEKVYGKEDIYKLKCVSHVRKKMGSRLRILKRLTDKIVDSLQVCCGQAIRQNTNSVPEMENAAMAIGHHISSNDNELNLYALPTRGVAIADAKSK